MLSELSLLDFDYETATTRRLLERVPDGKPDWRPHPRSMTLGRLATHVSELPVWVVNAFTKDELDLAPDGKRPAAEPDLPAGSGFVSTRGLTQWHTAFILMA